MNSEKDRYEDIAELICELTRNCNIKEEFFAASFNLSPTEVRLLKLFAFEERYSIREIRTKLNLTPGRITHILQSLENKNIIQRVPDENDKRNIHVKLLPKASPLIQNLHQNYNQLHEDLLKNVDQMEMKHMHDSLQILVDIFKKWINEK
jgi:MarR family 2-MHQ and catechol resistance regulon transcriptional repressor